jgi:DNA polymerase-3 subunit beta
MSLGNLLLQQIVQPDRRNRSGNILDFLKALDNEGEVRLEFKDQQSAGQMRPEDPDAEYKYRYVLMPMRI